jgi:hypothetical protein
MASRFWLRPLDRTLHVFFKASLCAPRPAPLGSAAAAGARYFHASAPARADAPKNPYTVLGVDKGASKEDIKKSYYKLVKKCAAWSRARGRPSIFPSSAAGAARGDRCTLNQLAPHAPPPPPPPPRHPPPK